MFKWIKSVFSKNNSVDISSTDTPKSPYAAVKVWFDEYGAWSHWPEKDPQAVAWSELIGVAVETTDQGPFDEDVWWHLATNNGVVTYPSEATGAGDLLERLQKIPTFNNERLIQAMGSTSNQTFILWDHKGRHQ